MVPLKDFEIDVLRRLTAAVLSRDVLNSALRHGEFLGYKYTGYGYYVTFRHRLIHMERIVCDNPLLIAESDGKEASFLVFLGKSEVVLECYPVDGEALPEAFRDKPLSIRVEKSG